MTQFSPITYPDDHRSLWKWSTAETTHEGVENHYTVRENAGNEIVEPCAVWPYFVWSPEDMNGHLEPQNHEGHEATPDILRLGEERTYDRHGRKSTSNRGHPYGKSMKTEFCKDFFRTGGACHFGTRCRYVHP